MIAEALCFLFRGHEWIRTTEYGQTWLQCLHCPARTKGWQIL